MTAVPNTVSLSVVADNAAIIASQHRSNYAALQTQGNGFQAVLSGGSAGQLLAAADSTDDVWSAAPTATGQVPVWNGTTWAMAFPVGYQFGYDQITTPVTVSSGTEATGTTVISCAAHTFDGAPVKAKFQATRGQIAASDTLAISLFEGATQIGRFCYVGNAAAATLTSPLQGVIQFTPTAAPHTYTVTAFRTSSNAVINAAAGGANTDSPCFVEFLKV